MINDLEKELRASIEGDVRFDQTTRRVYSVDASIFEIEPLGVVLPKTKEDLISAVKIANRHGVSIIPRGAATGITGGCLGKGLIIDLSKYLNNIGTIDIAKGTVVCQPGVVQDDLNTKLAHFGYRLGPDTSTGNRATLGGMLANNAAGARSLRYGKMVDHVLSVEILLADGQLVRFGPVPPKEFEQKRHLLGAEGNIYREVARLKEYYQDEIELHFPKIPRRVSGYNLDELIKPGPLNLAKLIVGSEGTLGIVTEMTLNIVPKPKALGLCLLFFQDKLEAMEHAHELLSYHPMSVEMVDDQIIQLGRNSPSMRGKMEWLPETPQALIIVELEGNNDTDVRNRIHTFTSEMHKNGIGESQLAVLDPIKMAHIWALRKAGLGILLSKRSYTRAIAFIEDLALPPDELAPFMTAFCGYLKSKGKEAGIYGHVGAGCMHLRPYMDLLDPSNVSLMKEMMNDISDLLLQYGGALSGEHGDGLIRSWLNPKMFGERLMQAFIALKRAFDPANRMNPGKIVFPEEPFKELRIAADSPLKSPKTFLSFQKEGGFALAVDLCNGNGLCRKKEGTMCPSFQVDNDEYHSTRARAQALRGIIHGHQPLEDFTSQELYDVLDLCISCKGCKTECPSQVDMAKMKAEFLYHYQKKHGSSLRSHLFGKIGSLYHMLSPLASSFNAVQGLNFSKKILGWIGVSPKRTLPALATRRFSKWAASYKQPLGTKGQVVLFNDTFNEYNHPEVGQAAMQLLNGLGYEVIIPTWTCCGRPLISKGMLEQARAYAKRVIKMLDAYAKQGLTIIGLEPSCILTITDDYRALIPLEDPLSPSVDGVLQACTTLDQFLAKLVSQGEFSLPFNEAQRTVKVHGHCHQKALVGMQPTMEVLKAIPGFNVEEIQSGCCGMAGSFGYEKEHFDFSMQIGELKLLPEVRSSTEDTLIIASGTSCRSQVKDGTQRQAVHLAEAILSQVNPAIN